MSISALREIGWTVWDPIGQMAPGKTWQDPDCAGFAAEYDRSLRRAAERLRGNLTLAENVEDLVRAELHNRGLGERADTKAHSKRGVEALAEHLAVRQCVSAA